MSQEMESIQRFFELANEAARMGLTFSFHHAEKRIHIVGRGPVFTANTLDAADEFLKICREEWNTARDLMIEAQAKEN